MSIELYHLNDTPILDGVKANIFITSALNEERARQLVAAQYRHSAECWFFLESSEDANSKTSQTNIVKIFPNAKFFDTKTLISNLKIFSNNFSHDIKTVCLDVSCIPHPVISLIMKELFIIAKQTPIDITIGYVIAKFTSPPEALPPNEDIKPIDEFYSGWPSDASATTALVLGLGYEDEKAEGACEYFDASETWVFVPRSPVIEYDQAVLENNRLLLERVNRQHRSLDYRVESPSNTFGQLIGLILALLPRSNPVILPFGPKIFFSLSLIAAALYPEVGVWHVTGDSSQAGTSQLGSEHMIAYTARLGPSRAVTV